VAVAVILIKMLIDDFFLWRRKKYGYQDENGVPLKVVGCPFKIYVCEGMLLVVYDNGIIEVLDDDGEFLAVCTK
jgi:hypothetical protein